MRLLPRFAEEDELDLAPEAQTEAPEPANVSWLWTAAVAAVAALPRFLYLFVFSNPENPGDGVYDDVWHHWQIAYLTKQIGLGAPDGPRLWDLKGMEYIWGPLHPLLMSAVFAVTGSVDIVLDRLVSLVFGVTTVVVVFHICRRHWGAHVAVAAALFAALLPTSVMNDASGMVEPMAIALTLIGVWAWTERRGVWAGIGFALAATARAEEWIFSAGLVVAAFLRRRDAAQRIPLLAGFLVAMVVYVKVLLDRTGNPIYPLWWNFIGHAGGEWGTPTITQSQAAMRPLFALLLLAAISGLAWALWKRPDGYMLLTFGFGYWVFLAGTYGFTAFLSDWQWWAPLTRRFEFPWLFAAILFTVGVLWWLPVKFGKRALPAAWAAVAGVLIASQLAWTPISHLFAPTEATWSAAMSDSRALGDWYSDPQYSGHALAVPADRPDITYGLARYGGVDGKHLISEMYAPEHLSACWFAKTDVRLIAADPAFMSKLQENASWFTHVGTMREVQWEVYAVHAPPCAGR